MKDILRLLAIPASLLLVFFIYYGLWQLFGLPKDAELAVLAKHWFDFYGLWFVFVSAFIEGVLLLGQYYPGGLVIFLSVIVAGHDIPRIITVVTVISLAFFIAYTVNYAMGKFGWYRLFAKFGLQSSLDTAQRKLLKHGLSAVVFSYWFPDLASITATAAGILQMSFPRFLIYSALGIIFWNTFWGALVATLGQSALQLMNLTWVLGIFFAWVAILLLKHFLYDKKRALGNPEKIV